MKKTNRVKVSFLGQSSSEVTNSMYLIEYDNTSILMDCGIYQSSNLVRDYRVNHRNIKIKSKDLDYIFISHLNADHCCYLPALYKKGCTAKIIVPKNSTKLLELMLKDSAKIFLSDVEKLRNKHDIKAFPLYDESDIQTCMKYVEEYDFNIEYKLSDTLKFKLFHAGHIINSSQIYLEIKTGNLIKRIGFTGDIGSNIDKHYIHKYTSLPYVDALLGECTYGGQKRNHSQKDRVKDLEKIQSIIQQYCIDNNNKVLFGVFSLDRLQTMLTILYEMYGNSESFKTKIIIDAPLGQKISEMYSDLIECDHELWEKVYSWENLIWCKEYTESKFYQELNEPMIILSTSAMCTSGRILGWVKKFLPNPDYRILFCGYSGDETIASRIKDYKHNKYIKIDGATYRNNCGITVLHSFSSHACRKELLERYSTMDYQKLFLVHSNLDDKAMFADDLRELLSKNNKTSKICVPVMDDEFYI